MSPSAILDEGVLMDTIGSISEPLSSMSTITPLVSLLTLAYQAKVPPPLEQERLVTLMQIMSAPPRPEALKEHSHVEFLGSFMNFLSPVLNGMAGMEDFEAAVGAFSQPEGFRDFWTLDGSNLIRDFIEGDAHERAVKGSGLPFLDVFVKDKSRRVALSQEGGMLLSVPGNAESGDEVWRGNGDAQMIMLRRRRGGGSGECIGEVFAYEQ